MSPPAWSSPSPPLTYSLISRHFHLPVSTAARILGVSRPTISKVLRAEGVPRWPYRALRAYARRADDARKRGISLPPPLDSPRTAARNGPKPGRGCVKKEEKEKEEVVVEEGNYQQVEQDQYNDEEGEEEDDEHHIYPFHSLHLPYLPHTHIAPTAENRCYTAASSYPSTAPSDFLPPPLPPPPFAAPHCVPVPESDNDWRCSETLEPSCTATSPQRPTTAASSPPRPRGHHTDCPATASHTVSTKGMGGGGVHRVLFGAPNWSRGIFSPDPKTGAMSFRFLGHDASEASAERVGSSLSITESELYNAVGSQIEVDVQGPMEASGESADEAEVGL